MIRGIYSLNRFIADLSASEIPLFLLFGTMDHGITPANGETGISTRRTICNSFSTLKSQLRHNKKITGIIMKVIDNGVTLFHVNLADVSVASESRIRRPPQNNWPPLSWSCLAFLLRHLQSFRENVGGKVFEVKYSTNAQKSSFHDVVQMLKWI